MKPRRPIAHTALAREKVVTAYKLIARDTVEEKILALQQKKRALVDATIESEQPLMDGLESLSRDPGDADVELYLTVCSRPSFSSTSGGGPSNLASGTLPT